MQKTNIPVRFGGRYRVTVIVECDPPATTERVSHPPSEHAPEVRIPSPVGAPRGSDVTTERPTLRLTDLELLN